ncbi:unnamed protein product [Boreogadus saida]
MAVLLPTDGLKVNPSARLRPESILGTPVAGYLVGHLLETIPPIASAPDLQIVRILYAKWEEMLSFSLNRTDGVVKQRGQFEGVSSHRVLTSSLNDL